jgi:hypothetical protein
MLVEDIAERVVRIEPRRRAWKSVGIEPRTAPAVNNDFIDARAGSALFSKVLRHTLL